MPYEFREFARVRNYVLLVSSIAWMLLLFNPSGIAMLVHCAAMDSGAMPPPESLRMLRSMNPPAALALGWAVMLAAMMAPVLIAPICHIRLRSFADRRERSVALFVSAYGAVFMLLGVVLLAIGLVASLFAPQSNLPWAAAAMIALFWQASPLKQRCLNRCHAHTSLAAFGAAADFAAVRFGLAHGVWCAGSCWALMLFPMLLPHGHAAAMAAVAILIFSERLEHPQLPRWRLRGLGPLIRITAAQARMRLQQPPATVRS